MDLRKTTNTKLISLFLNSNRKIYLTIQLTREFNRYYIGTSAYDILKEKISKNQKLLKLKNLLRIKKFRIIF